MFYKILFLFLIMSFFIACGSSAPVTEINPLALKETEAIVISTPMPDSIQKTPIEEKSDSLVFPEDISTSSVDTLVKEKKKVINPYQDIPALVQEVLKYADTLLSKGNMDSAATYLEQFIVLKPLWDEWQKEAQNIYLRTKKTQTMRVEEFKPLILQITNMNSVGASYDLIKVFTDSLVSLNPGDSLIFWAEKQNKIAFHKNLSKARQEKEKILSNANKNNQFNTAQEQILQLKSRYYYFEDSLQLETTLTQLKELESSLSKEDQLYWESHDPKASLNQAQKWISEKKYTQAKALLVKLKSSSLRQQALEQMEVLAELFCNEERKKTSVLYQSAQKTSNVDQRKDKLVKAIDGLNRCLDQYPEYSQKEKVLNNRSFLENELSK